MADVEEPETLADTLGRLEVIPVGLRTSAEQTELNRARHVWEQERRRKPAKVQPAITPAPVESSRARAVIPGPSECPFDPTSPEGVRWLLARTLGQVSAIVSDPAATNRDILDAASMLRMAAGLGKEAPVPTESNLDMASMLGTAPDVTCPACSHRFDPEEGQAGNVGPSTVDDAGLTGKADVST